MKQLLAAVLLLFSAAAQDVPPAVVARNNSTFLTASNTFAIAGTDLDRRQAQASLEQLASAGHVPSMMLLAEANGGHWGIPENKTAALAYYTAAANKGVVEAAFRAGLLSRDSFMNHSADYRAALGFLKRAANAGHLGATDALGEMYQTGKGVPVDYAIARQYYERSGNFFAVAQLCESSADQFYWMRIAQLRKNSSASTAEAASKLSLSQLNTLEQSARLYVASRWPEPKTNTTRHVVQKKALQ